MKCEKAVLYSPINTPKNKKRHRRNFLQLVHEWRASDKRVLHTHWHTEQARPWTWQIKSVWIMQPIRWRIQRIFPSRRQKSWSYRVNALFRKLLNQGWTTWKSGTFRTEIPLALAFQKLSNFGQIGNTKGLELCMGNWFCIFGNNISSPFCKWKIHHFSNLD